MRLHRRHLLTRLALATTATTTAGCLTGTANNGPDGSDTPDAIPEDPRTDEPPYPITKPDDGEDWDPHFLCRHMPTDSDLEWKHLSAPRLPARLLADSDRSGAVYAVRALTSPSDVEAVFDTGIKRNTTSDETEEPLTAIDFTRYVVLVVESGFGSGAITHHWKRVEETPRGFRLHGCHYIPEVRTMDAAPRHSVVKVARPPGFEVAHVSLTVSPDQRVHFNSTEGVVAVDQQ